MRDGIDVEYYISAMTVESELMKHVEREEARKGAEEAAA